MHLPHGVVMRAEIKALAQFLKCPIIELLLVLKSQLLFISFLATYQKFGILLSVTQDWFLCHIEFGRI